MSTLRLEAIAELPARTLKGRYHRIVPQYLKDRVLSLEGSKLYGGRYNIKGVFGALYCCASPDVCRAEVRKATAGRMLGPFLSASVQVKLQRVLDLTDQTNIRQLDIRPEDLVNPNWAFTQEIGRLAREAGFEALLVPSAAASGNNLVLFPDLLDPASSIRLIALKPTTI